MLNVVVSCGNLKVTLFTAWRLVGVELEVHLIVSLALAREKPPKEEDNRMLKTLRWM